MRRMKFIALAGAAAIAMSIGWQTGSVFAQEAEQDNSVCVIPEGHQPDDRSSPTSAVDALINKFTQDLQLLAEQKKYSKIIDCYLVLESDEFSEFRGVEDVNISQTVLQLLAQTGFEDGKNREAMNVLKRSVSNDITLIPNQIALERYMPIVEDSSRLERLLFKFSKIAKLYKDVNNTEIAHLLRKGDLDAAEANLNSALITTRDQQYLNAGYKMEFVARYAAVVMLARDLERFDVDELAAKKWDSLKQIRAFYPPSDDRDQVARANHHIATNVRLMMQNGEFYWPEKVLEEFSNELSLRSIDPFKQTRDVQVAQQLYLALDLVQNDVGIENSIWMQRSRALREASGSTNIEQNEAFLEFQSGVMGVLRQMLPTEKQDRIADALLRISSDSVKWSNSSALSETFRRLFNIRAYRITMEIYNMRGDKESARAAAHNVLQNNNFLPERYQMPENQKAVFLQVLNAE